MKVPSVGKGGGSDVSADAEREQEEQVSAPPPPPKTAVQKALPFAVLAGAFLLLRR